MEDKFLVLKCKRGSRDALERIYQKYKADLLILAIALLNEKSAAEDLVHDVFLSFVQSLEKFRLTGSLKGYLLTCAANRARNVNKAKQHRSIEANPAVPVTPAPDEPTHSIIYNEQLQQLSEAMAHLSYEQREVIMLHFQAGMTFKNIAASLGIPVNTAKSRYRYGIDKLRSTLDDEVKNETSR